MKRILKIVGLVVALLVVSAVALIAPVFLSRRSVPESFEIGGIRVVKDGFVSVAVVPMGEGEVALVDAGNDRSGAAIVAELARSGLESAAVRAILITHGHPDHIAAIPAFPRAQVMALAPEVPLIEGRIGARGPIQRLFPVRPTGVKVQQALQDGEVVTLGSARIRVFAVPGHTAGSAAYLVNDVLFLGDSADAGRDGALKGAPWVFSDSQTDNRASLVRLHDRLAGEQAVVTGMVFSHSGAFTEGLGPLAAFAQNNR
jgi:glyoxylase-like metal-dependent hydrolase (beta-lactamase superfamily II)